MPSTICLKALAICFLVPFGIAQTPPYQPCPLLGPFVPAPSINASSPAIEQALGEFSALLDSYINKADGQFGPITPNSTSFSIALFAGSSYVAEDDAPPFFYDYHHTAQKPAAGVNATSRANINSAYALGELTQLFTVYTLLAELGDGVLQQSIVDYLPELLENTGSDDTVTQVEWHDVTLGSLAGQMAGIARDWNDFLAAFRKQPPVYLPDTTPIFSNAAFQILAFAMEAKTKTPFPNLLASRILDSLDMTSTTFLKPSSKLIHDGLSNTTLTGAPAARGLISTPRDLSVLGRAILTSQLLSPAQTRRWLKPVTSTSNLRNAVGRPWEIYHFSDNAIDPITDIYTKTGSLGHYSSYFGLAPDFDVGFVILAEDEQVDGVDLNAYADLMLAALLGINKIARLQAVAAFAGNFTTASNSGIMIAPTGEDPGLAVLALQVNGTDWLAEVATQAGIEPENVDFRIYPTDLKQRTANGHRQAFRAVVQDKNALVDAGTPTCISWMGVGVLQRGGLPLDLLLLDLNEDGRAVNVSIPALARLQGADYVPQDLRRIDENVLMTIFQHHQQGAGTIGTSLLALPTLAILSKYSFVTTDVTNLDAQEQPVHPEMTFVLLLPVSTGNSAESFRILSTETEWATFDIVHRSYESEYHCG
nr:beta-lactamase-like protein [Quercus suber]